MVVLETANLIEIEVSVYCRNNGIYPEQVKEWKVTCMNANDDKIEKNFKANKELNEEHRQKKRWKRNYAEKRKPLQRLQTSSGA